MKSQFFQLEIARWHYLCASVYKEIESAIDVLTARGGLRLILLLFLLHLLYNLMILIGEYIQNSMR
jgi:hypothetical protein